MDRLPLEGVRIIDLTQQWAGPYATELLAMMGAQVIKVESRKRPDGARMYSGTLRQAFEGLDQSPAFNELNANKLGITLDLTQPRAVELVKELVRISDVVAENFRPGVMERMGLGYEVLREVKPDIIMLSSSARGATGPERGYSGYAPGFAGLGGLAYITGYSDGNPYPQSGRIDLLSGVTAAFAMLAALNCHQMTGKGQHIDLSSSESIAVLVGDVLMDYTMNKRVQYRRGNRDDVMAPHNCYRCKGNDKWVSIAVATDEEWDALCQAMGNPEWARAEKFSDAYSRWQNQDELDRRISEWTERYTDYEVMELLQSVGVAAVPSFSSEEIYSDPHLKERGLATQVEHPMLGKQSIIVPPWRLSETPAMIYRHAPLFGEHNEYVFGELLGMSKQDINQLIESKVIY